MNVHYVNSTTNPNIEALATVHARLTSDRSQGNVNDLLSGVVGRLLPAQGALGHHPRVVLEVFHRITRDEHEGVHEQHCPALACHIHVDALRSK